VLWDKLKPPRLRWIDGTEKSKNLAIYHRVTGWRGDFHDRSRLHRSMGELLMKREIQRKLRRARDLREKLLRSSSSRALTDKA